MHVNRYSGEKQYILAFLCIEIEIIIEGDLEKPDNKMGLKIELLLLLQS